jgi:hypothetical protein
LSSSDSRITAPARIFSFGGALSVSARCANLSPAPVTSACSPFASTARTCVGVALSTTPVTMPSLSG